MLEAQVAPTIIRRSFIDRWVDYCVSFPGGCGFDYLRTACNSAFSTTGIGRFLRWTSTWYKMSRARP